ncbi:MAG: hypothetical protein E3J45_03005 [Candidatus Zixiibacteriota bacterium]|nr:MAG: hypothetical protein E3J45_03005 [candidate division Zixibacteria bacterium]
MSRRQGTGNRRWEIGLGSPIHYSLFTIHYSLFTIYYLLFTIYYLPLTGYPSSLPQRRAASRGCHRVILPIDAETSSGGGCTPIRLRVGVQLPPQLEE